MSKRIACFTLAVLSAALLAPVVTDADAADPQRYKAYYKIFNRGNAPEHVPA